MLERNDEGGLRGGLQGKEERYDQHERMGVKDGNVREERNLPHC